jgi:predicted RNA binding protein YcfA (HicA-like mRNA interferase family)
MFFNLRLLPFSTTGGTIFLLRWEVIAITTADKLEKRLRKTPTPNDVPFDELQRFLEANGFYLKKSSGGSHRQFIYNQNGVSEIVGCPEPHSGNKYVLKPYIQFALMAVDRIRSRG